MAGVVSLFIEPEPEILDVCGSLGVRHVELHTGAYANARGTQVEAELERLKASTLKGSGLGLHVHAGHGLTLDNVSHLARIPQIEDFNIGHAIVSRALFVGLKEATREMKQRILV